MATKRNLSRTELSRLCNEWRSFEESFAAKRLNLAEDKKGWCTTGEKSGKVGRAGLENVLFSS